MPVSAMRLPSERTRTATAQSVAAKLKRHPKGVNLQLGCGAAVQASDEWITMDMLPVPGAVQHDLELYPWPLPDGCARLVTAGMVLPKINPARLGVFRWFNELWRVMKPDAEVLLTSYYGSSPAWSGDPTAVCAVTEQTFFYLDPLHASKLYAIYRPLPWRLRDMTFQAIGTMEVVMAKRRIDSSYKVREWA